MTVSTYTRTNTRTFTHTATHLSGVIVSVLAETLLAIGISSDRVSRVYGYDTVIAAWIREQSLGRLKITLTPPGGSETAGYSFEIDYTAWDPEQQFRDQLARLRRQICKEPNVRSGTTFEVIAFPRSGWNLSDQPGWGTTTRALPSFDGGYRHGTAGSGPGASAVLRSHRI